MVGPFAARPSRRAREVHLAIHNPLVLIVDYVEDEEQYEDESMQRSARRSTSLRRKMSQNVLDKSRPVARLR